MMEKITLFFAAYGDMEGTVWANAQFMSDFVNEEGRAGCQVGKAALDTSNNNKLGKRLVGELQRSEKPIEIKPIFTLKVQGGKMVNMLKDYQLLGAKA